MRIDNRSNTDALSRMMGSGKRSANRTFVSSQEALVISVAEAHARTSLAEDSVYHHHVQIDSMQPWEPEAIPA